MLIFELLTGHVPFTGDTSLSVAYQRIENDVPSPSRFISGVPPGRYKLKAWHERLPSQVQEITVPETGEVRADFALGIINLPKY